MQPPVINEKHGAITLGIMTFGITTFSVTTLSVKCLFITLAINGIQQRGLIYDNRHKWYKA